MKVIYTLATAILLFLTLNSGLAQSTNDNCSSATSLTANASCTTGHLNDNGSNTTETNEVTSPGCTADAFNETVWYSFTATATKMYVQVVLSGFTGNGGTWTPTDWGSVVYHSTACPPPSSSIVSCKNSNSQGSADGVIENVLTNLTIGDTYKIQIGYHHANGASPLAPDFCINVGSNFETSCTTCSSPCGPACGYTSTPTSVQLAACPYKYNQVPYNEGGVTDSACYTYTANATTVAIQVANTGTCSGGVTSLNWTNKLSTCTGASTSGTLSNLNITGLTIGQTYTVCLYITIPVNCYYSQWEPWFVGAVPLPIELSFFSVNVNEGMVNLTWETESETNNNFFSIERSVDAKNFESLGTINGAGTSTLSHSYSAVDREPIMGISYYRLKQVDFDGTFNYSNVVPINITRSSQITFVSDPNSNSVTITSPSTAQVKIYNITGQIIWMSNGLSAKISIENWAVGEYFVTVINQTDLEVIRVNKSPTSVVGKFINSNEQKLAQLPPTSFTFPSSYELQMNSVLHKN